ncbi:hypothetical protein [Bifidobacterium longum]|uniref:hypothetical protein n=1 Tax=Bifidobacterium longum TaxID=216816 RepID=UPI0035677677
MGVDIGGLVASGVVSAVVAMAFKYFDRPHSSPWLRWLRKTYRWPLATLQVEHGLSARIYAPESIPVWRQLLGAIGKYELQARQEALRGERHLRPSSEQSKQ